MKNIQNDKHFSTSNYYVAFLDFLGAKQFMLSDNDNFLCKMSKIYHESTELLEKVEKTYLQKLNYKKIEIKIFSDNILLAIKLDENINDEIPKLECLIMLAGLIQVTALKYGYLIRGGISKGKFFISEKSKASFVYGKALVEAYTLESNQAIYPRIIIQRKNIFDTRKLFTCKSEDDYYYINYYYFSKPENFKKFRKTLLKLYKSSQDNEHIKQKILWTINYHNNYMNEKFVDNIPQNNKLKIEISDLLN